MFSHIMKFQVDCITIKHIPNDLDQTKLNNIYYGNEVNVPYRWILRANKNT